MAYRGTRAKNNSSVYATECKQEKKALETYLTLGKEKKIHSENNSQERQENEALLRQTLTRNNP